MGIFSTAPVEIAVDIFAILWKRNMGGEFSTFPQGTFSLLLWKCGKLLVNSLILNN
jgi:hypothetical protein